ncbi:MAG TPA: glycoside hydrolase family 18 protein [Puia sp.]|nr:glycoside hydrolase family 18 protein [Puia sp.]
MANNLPAAAQKKAKPVIIGYIGGFRGTNIDAGEIDAKGLSHINYAFVDVKDNRAWLHNEKTDTINFRVLNELKKINPDLKILISIGGWIWSKNFSDAVFTDSSTANFAQSAADIVSKYNLDGVDIDWEYPGMIGDSNGYRPEDRIGYTNLFKQLRSKLDALTPQTGRKYFVTTAIGNSPKYLQHTQMEVAQQYLDYINLMAYDMDGYDNMAGHQSNLYTPNDMPYISSADEAITNLQKVGVNLSKVVLGMPFYGKGKIVKSGENNGLYQIPTSRERAGGYTYLKDSLVNMNGFVRYWDPKANAPYLYNADKKEFVTYDDEQSIRDKCDYIKKRKLAGAMFWEWSSDKKQYLLHTIDKEFGYKL